MTNRILLLLGLIGSVAAGGYLYYSANPASTGETYRVRLVAQLPDAVSNNAVAAIEIAGQTHAFSFAGLHSGKAWNDVTSDAYACILETGRCDEVAGLPDGIGRLASIAATAGEHIYIFGGYTVGEDGSERSTPEVWQFDPVSMSYTRMADIPLPVDDSVALVYDDRYIYLVSGWHDHDNVATTQLFDSRTGEWSVATDWPGSPVFGHAGGILDRQMLICGGVEVVPPASPNARRTFELYEACWTGEIDPVDPSRVEWAPAHIPGAARYRAAMTGSERLGGFVVIGGTDNPYNYNGIGYNGAPSEPDDLIIVNHNGSIERITRPGFSGRMDHRGLLEWSGGFVTVGGMAAGQIVSDEVRLIPLD
jgi:Kelch motif